MPLRDHFRGRLEREPHWHSFRNSWATTIAYALNDRLPGEFRASANAPRAIEIDRNAGSSSAVPASGPGGEVWEPSPGTMTLPFEFVEPAAEVLVHGRRDGSYLAAAIELVSEGNKGSAAARGAFVAKCETYLHSGAGVIIFDPVTTQRANLHDDLMARLGPGVPVWGERLHCTAYRPSGRKGSAKLTVWQEALTLGAALPTMPLWLLHGPCVPVHLEATYEDTSRRLRLPTEEP